MTSHDVSSRTDSSGAERVLNLSALRALAEQGHFRAVLMNEDAVVVETLEEGIRKNCIVAWAYSRLGHQEEAARLANAAYLESLASFGEDHELTLLALNDFARFSHRAGRTDVGLRSGEDVLERRRRVLGERHPQTLTSRANLLRYRYEQDLSVSPAELDELLEAWRSVDPARKDPAHLSAALLRADVMQSLAARARAEVVAWYISALGDEHPDTLRATTSL